MHPTRLPRARGPLPALVARVTRNVGFAVHSAQTGIDKLPPIYEPNGRGHKSPNGCHGEHHHRAGGGGRETTAETAKGGRVGPHVLRETGPFNRSSSCPCRCESRAFHTQVIGGVPKATRKLQHTMNDTYSACWDIFLFLVKVFCTKNAYSSGIAHSR